MSKNNQKHGFHLVDVSPWPLLLSLSALMLTFGAVLYMHGYTSGFFLFRLGLEMILFMMFVWWNDVVRESTFEGQHTLIVQKGIRLGMLLFIVSEVMFFFAFFWGFFYSSFNPSQMIGGIWPPSYLVVINPWQVPLLNTILLLSSGASVTWAHHSIVWGSKDNAVKALICTIFLSFVFTALQAWEYLTASFTLSDSIYGSTFYLTTGFHGFHVFVGTVFLSICLIRLVLNHFTREHHLGFEAAAWYWHFVDVVWLFLFLTIYWWGS